MQVTETELIRGVRVDMEELTPEWMAEVTEADSVGVDAYVTAKLPDALRSVLLIAPAWCLDPADGADVWEPERRQDGSGRVLLPENLLRMVEFRMRGWRRTVTEFPGATGSQAAMQSHPFLRGGVERPVCLLGYGSERRRALYYYALPPALRVHRIERALYVPDPVPEDGVYTLAMELVSAAQYYCAGLVYELMGRPDMAAVMQQRALL